MQGEGRGEEEEEPRASARTREEGGYAAKRRAPRGARPGARGEEPRAAPSGARGGEEARSPRQTGIERTPAIIHERGKANPWSSPQR